MTLALTHTNTLDARTILERSQLSPATVARYATAWEHYTDLFPVATLSPTSGQAHMATLSHNGQKLFRSVVSRMIGEMETMAKSSATPDNIDHIDATLYRLQAFRDSLHLTKHAPTHIQTHVWLSPAQIVEMYNHTRSNAPTKALRDLILLKLAFRTGMRRNELAHIEFSDIRDATDVSGTGKVLFVTGKGAKVRKIALDDELVALLDHWYSIVGDGPILRGINKGDNLTGGGMSGVAIHSTIAHYGRLIGIEALSAHDTRRTFAMILWNGGVKLEDVSRLMGHANTQTTETYLNLKERTFHTVPGDYIP